MLSGYGLDASIRSATMNAKRMKHEKETEQMRESPVCLRCLRPLDPRAYYCPHCGEAAGQLTPYLPLVNIPWQTRIWGQMWEQVWSRRVSVPGRLFRLFMIFWNVPILLIAGLVVRLWHWPHRQEQPPAALSDDEDVPVADN
jgi:hypothetical protein